VLFIFVGRRRHRRRRSALLPLYDDAIVLPILAFLFRERTPLPLRERGFAETFLLIHKTS
jgi:hypothetical protein